MLKKISKKILLNYKEYLYHKSHRIAAYRILGYIESVKGPTNPKFIKLSKEYAYDVLGWIGFAPWLYVYSAISEEFKEGWIPDNYYGQIVVPIINGRYGEIENLKAISAKLFDSNFFPDIAYFVNGLYFSRSYSAIPEEKIKEILFSDSNVVVFKIDKSLQGKGVYFFEKSQFNSLLIHSLGNGVFQRYIEQHDFLKKLSPTAVSTLRLTTAFDNNGFVNVRSCYLRIGRTSDTHVKSDSHIRIPVNFINGELFETGYLKNWMPINRHPDTNVIFKKEQIPLFQKCSQIVTGLHTKMPFARIIGWDLTINNKNQVEVMEWNSGHNDIKFSEATQGPCFADLGWENFWKMQNL